MPQPAVKRRSREGDLFRQMTALQRKKHRFVQQHRNCRVEAAFDQIKRQKGGKQQRGDVLSRHSHIERGDEIIPEHHRYGHRKAAAEKSGGHAGKTTLFPVDKCGAAGEGTARQDVHEKAQRAGAADGQHLDERDNKRDDKGSRRAEKKAADGDDDVFRFVLQEEYEGDAYEGRGKIGDGAEHSDGCEFLCVFHWFYLLN